MSQIDFEFLSDRLKNNKISQILIQEYYYQNELVEQANSIIFKVLDSYICLSIDVGLLFCSESQNKPLTKEIKSEGFLYKIIDISKDLKIIEEIKINECVCNLDDNRLILTFYFTNGYSLEVTNQNDNTSYAIYN